MGVKDGKLLSSWKEGCLGSPAQPPGAEQTGLGYRPVGSTPSSIREDMQIIRGLLVLAASKRVSYISAFMALDMISLILQQPDALGVLSNLRKRKLLTKWLK